MGVKLKWTSGGLQNRRLSVRGRPLLPIFRRPDKGAGQTPTDRPAMTFRRRPARSEVDPRCPGALPSRWPNRYTEPVLVERAARELRKGVVDEAASQSTSAS
jgi:hypothetical protein